MTKNLKKCKECGRYALKNPDLKCKYCRGDLITPKPPKFSPIDKYAKYRIPYFKDEFRKKFGNIKGEKNAI